ncbi:MAG: dTDP-4-dehydrorhamnose 3,5-epimerase [Cyanobacteria bacterium 13_1_40CM_2_61_4]|nr:MAG: dTDP-4-dehydrorhamnose 3,5-epimerase [Cyanobacteria bacterium 13_1_40CM_2_61_4]
MRFVPTSLAGVYVIEQERHIDERGFFARTWCADEFADHGLEPKLAQCNVSFNRCRGTLRGVHYQVPPFAEVKLVRCTRGAIFDVAVDLRPDSPTFRRWVGSELTEDNGRALYVPRGCALGFLTLADDTELSYEMSTPYAPEAQRGLRWDDPFVGVAWPERVQVISSRDRDYPDMDVSQLEELRGLLTAP